MVLSGLAQPDPEQPGDALLQADAGNDAGAERDFDEEGRDIDQQAFAQRLNDSLDPD